MYKKTSVLQVGLKNFDPRLQDDDRKALKWNFLKLGMMNEETLEAFIEKAKGRTFDVVLVTDKLDLKFLKKLSPLIETYGMIIDRKFKHKVSGRLKDEKLPLFMDVSQPQTIIQEIKKNFFSGQMGSKLHTNTIAVNEKFKGQIKLYGESFIQLKGDFSSFSELPVLTWQHNIGLYGRAKKIWLEFDHDEGIEFSLRLIKIIESSSEVAEVVDYPETELKAGIEVPYEKKIGYLNISLLVKGHGRLQVGPLHFRDSRQHYGEYLLGGKKINDSQNQEIFYYFHPGDLKPPLNVYFSGYRSAEGFEGFFMMKRLGAPFLLITDPRLEGGSFYMGSETLEHGVVKIIKNHLSHLGFSSEQLILSGLSMGTFGALYYASQLEPGHVIVGKPLVNVGDIAKNEKIIRPGGFPTSLDILKSLTGTLNQEGVKVLNQRFWTQFDKGSFSNTHFIIAYMRHDDYDVNAYYDILSHLSDRDSTVISKGVDGRHNDNSQAINQWFINQYTRILREKFKRNGTR